MGYILSKDMFDKFGEILSGIWHYSQDSHEILLK